MKPTNFSQTIKKRNETKQSYKKKHPLLCLAALRHWLANNNNLNTTTSNSNKNGYFGCVGWDYCCMHVKEIRVVVGIFSCEKSYIEAKSKGNRHLRVSVFIPHLACIYVYNNA